MDGVTAYVTKKNIKISISKRAMACLMDVNCMSDARNQIHVVELPEHDSEDEEAQEKRLKNKNKENIKKLKERNVIVRNNKGMLAYCAPALRFKKVSITFIMLVQLLTMIVSIITI